MAEIALVVALLALAAIFVGWGWWLNRSDEKRFGEMRAAAFKARQELWAADEIYKRMAADAAASAARRDAIRNHGTCE